MALQKLTPDILPKLREAMQNPNVQAFGDEIAKAEGTAGHGPQSYNVLYGGRLIPDLSKHPSIYQQGPSGPTSAFGRYQFVKRTWDEIAPTLGLTDMSPEAQDLAMVARLYQRGQLDNVLAGNFDQARRNLGDEWEGFKRGGRGAPSMSNDDGEDVDDGFDLSQLPSAMEIDLDGMPGFAMPTNEDEFTEMREMAKYDPQVRTLLLQLGKQLSDAENASADNNLFGDNYPDMYDERLRALIERA